MPRAYTYEEIEAMFEEICKLVTEGDHLNSILKYSGMPSYHTFYNWIDYERLDEPTEQQINDCKRRFQIYARAREARSELIFNEILDIADDSSRDTKVLEDGKEVVDHEVVQRSRLRIDARKWVLAKMQPKKYGDKIDVTSDGEKITNNSQNMNITLPDGKTIDEYIERVTK